MFKKRALAPYALAGDVSGDYKDWPYKLNVEYILKATPYVGGVPVGTPREIVFSLVDGAVSVSITPAPVTPEPITPAPVTPSPITLAPTTAPPTTPAPVTPSPITLAPVIPTGLAVNSLSLINARNNAVLQDNIVDNSSIDISGFDTTVLNVRANTSGGTVGSVVFDLNGKKKFRTENAAPYALAGDINGNYLKWEYDLRSVNTIKATPYPNGGGSGLAGKPLTIHFTLVD